MTETNSELSTTRYFSDQRLNSPEEYLISWEYRLANGVTLRGQRTRPSGKPVVHFLHGNGFCGLSYWPMLSHLVQDFDLFIHDIQGHGDSDHGDCFWGWNENAEIAAEVLQSFSSDYNSVEVFGAGHSLGGVLTALAGAQVPLLFSRVILLDPVIFSPQMIMGMQLFKFLRLKNPNPLAKKALKRRNQWLSRCEAMSDFNGRGIFKGWDDAALRAHVEHALCEQGSELISLKCAPEREAEIFSSFPRRLWSALKQLKCPALIIYGNQTYPFVKHSVHRLHRLNSQVEFQELKGGHCFMQEYPQVTASAIQSWLKPRSESR